VAAVSMARLLRLEDGERRVTKCRWGGMGLAAWWWSRGAGLVHVFGARRSSSVIFPASQSKPPKSTRAPMRYQGSGRLS
jgi:hypothetical protein